MDVLKAIKEIEKSANQHTEQEIRKVEKHTIGKAIRQGDVYVHMVASDYPIGKELPIRQIADGISIGQRHILKGHCKVYECTQLPNYINSDFNNLISYAFDVLEDGCLLTHPEHAHVELYQKGRCVVTYQMDAQTRKRVQD